MHSGIPFFNTHSCRKIIYTAARSHPLLPSSKRNSRGGFGENGYTRRHECRQYLFLIFFFGLDIIHTTLSTRRLTIDGTKLGFVFSFSAWRLFHHNHTHSHSHTQPPSARVVVLGLHMVSLDRQPELSAPPTHVKGVFSRNGMQIQPGWGCLRSATGETIQGLASAVRSGIGRPKAKRRQTEIVRDMQ